MFKFAFINKLCFLAFILLTSFFCLSTTIYSQSKPTRFDHITQNQGLSSNSVLSILQDKKGFLWVGTEFGLNRYDGHSFRIYQPPSIPSNVVTSICEDKNENLWIGTADSGLLKYIPEEDKFISVKIDNLKKTDGSFLYILYLTEDKEANLWIATPDVLVKFDTKTNLAFSYFEGNYVPYLCLDRENNFWVITSPKEKFILVNFDPKTGETLKTIPIEGLLKAEYSSLAYQPNGNLYVATPNGLYIIDTTSKEILSHYPDLTDDFDKSLGYATCLYFFNDNTLWIGTYNGGVAELNLHTRQITNYKHNPRDPESLIGNHISTIYKDRSGVFWIGDKVYGLNKLSPYKNFFRIYRHNPFDDNSLSNNYIRGIFEDSKGFLWVATQFGGLNKINRRNDQITRYQYKQESNFSLPDAVWAVYEDSKGVLWVGTSPNGLYTYDYNKDILIKSKLLPSLVRETHVNVIYEDSLGNLLVGTSDGLYKISPNRESTVILYNRYDPDTKDLQVGFDIQSIFEDSRKNIWVGTNDGILKFNLNNYQDYVIYRKELPSEKSNNIYINSFLEDSEGTIWVASKGLGLLNFNPKTNQFNLINQRNNLIHINTYGILLDEQGAFWVSTDNGLTRYNPKTNSFETFGITDGLQGKEFNRRAFFKNSLGELFFGGVNGLNSFFPNQINKNTNPPPVFITNVTASGKSLLIPTDSNSSLELRYIDNTLTFAFAALDFNAPENNLYAYKLSDFDKDWVQVRNKGDVTYTNLAPGKYTFFVKGTNNHQVWGLKTIELAITIFPPPWQTTWAYFIYLLLIISSIVFTVRYYKNKVNIQTERLRAEKAEIEARALERENQQRIETETQIKLKNIELEEANQKLKQLDEIKAKFTAMLVHDLKSPLTVVNATLEMLSENKSNNDKNTFLQTSKKNVQKIVSMVNEVLEFYQASSEEMKFNFEPVNLVEIIVNCVEAAKISATSKDISFKISVKDEVKLISADSNKLDRVFNNLFSNAIKFTPKNGQIFIEIYTRFEAEKDLSTLCISIVDTGEGIASEDLPYVFEPYRQAKSSKKKAGVGLGLATVKSIVEAHNGSIFVESELGKRTSFTVTFPIISNTSSKFTLQSQAVEKETPEILIKESFNAMETRVKKILVVDDDLISQKIVFSKLRTMGYEVDLASNGLEAISHFSSSSYDLILLDNYMPEMDGLDAAKEIRKKEIGGSHTPIILFTADSTQTPNSSDLIDDLIEKPFDAKKLEKVINLWLAKDSAISPKGK